MLQQIDIYRSIGQEQVEDDGMVFSGIELQKEMERQLNRGVKQGFDNTSSSGELVAFLQNIIPRELIVTREV